MAHSFQTAHSRLILRLLGVLAMTSLVLLASPSAWRADTMRPDRKLVSHALKVRRVGKVSGYDLYFVNDTPIQFVVTRIGSDPFPCEGYKVSFRATIVAVPRTELDRVLPERSRSVSLDGDDMDAARRFFFENDKVLRSGLQLECEQDVALDGPERILDTFVFDGIDGRTLHIRPEQRVLIQNGVSSELPPLNGARLPR